mmetsp:Transcript_16681/g.38133  ORF Transcript_16681/g.38133 Transcript_16681/m.38133 type:complete len:88 (+) Transcript_16681:156-419(+)
MNDDLFQNRDVIHHVLTFLSDDGTSIFRFALSSKALYDRIIPLETIDNSSLWKELIHHRWKRTRLRPAMSDCNRDEDNDSENNDAVP